MQTPEVTLIVAATRSMGIGLNGTMPWTGLRNEMQYFARVTTRAPPRAAKCVNAVIMGRKTWESIPPRFRPLKDRLNIVISRTAGDGGGGGSVRVASLDEALEVVKRETVGRVFVMGGGQIYEQALQRGVVSRVLLTSIEREFECDTFLKLDLGAWTRRTAREWREWTGEEGDERREENGTAYEWQMWER